MYKNKSVLPLVGLIHEADLEGRYKETAYKMAVEWVSTLTHRFLD